MTENRDADLDALTQVKQGSGALWQMAENLYAKRCPRMVEQPGWDSAKSEGLWGGDEHIAPPKNGQPCDPDTEDCRLDPGVYELVWGLYEAGIETGWSCQGGGEPHAYLTRLIALGVNDEDAGPRALEVAQRLKMPVLWLHRVKWVGPGHPDFWWELHFDRWTNWTRGEHGGPTDG